MASHDWLVKSLARGISTRTYSYNYTRTEPVYIIASYMYHLEL